MNGAHTDSTFRFTGWHMLGCMLAFFGTIIAVNVTMAVFASGSWTGLVVKNSYVASQAFNGELERARKQAAAGLSSHVEHTDGVLKVRIADRKGAVQLPQAISIWIGRPAFEQKDAVLETQCDPAGECAGKIQFEPGIWALRIEAELVNGPYRRDARLAVKSDGTVAVE